MATKQALASKLQLTVSYTDEAGKKKTRTLNFSSLKADADKRQRLNGRQRPRILTGGCLGRSERNGSVRNNGVIHKEDLP